MYSFVFALLSLAVLLFYGMLHTLFFAKKIKHDSDKKNSYLKYGRKLGLYGCLSLLFAIMLYLYGVG